MSAPRTLEPRDDSVVLTSCSLRAHGDLVTPASGALRIREVTVVISAYGTLGVRGINSVIQTSSTMRPQCFRLAGPRESMTEPR